MQSSLLLRSTVLAVILLAACAAPVSRAHAVGIIPPGSRTLDFGNRCDGNRLSMFVTNAGSFAFDASTANPGLEYPKGSEETVMFAAGLWLGAKVGSQKRMAVAEYSFEYGPGPMVGGGAAPDSPRYKVYKISRADTTGWADWAANAGPLGAPVSAGGAPLVSGSQTLWTVYNDANPALHTNEAGSTAPLGIEVRETVWCRDDPGPMGQVIYLRFLLLNQGSNTLDSAYVGLWADPDLGGFTDDLAGCDVPLGLGYCYNSTNNDLIYGTTPPAVGIQMLAGPRDPDTGDRLPMTSFIRYINGTDPTASSQSYNYLRGLNADGSTIIDPVTTLPTRFMMSGDPVAGTGWLDSAPSDRRFLIGCGPFHMIPGQTEELVCAVLVGQGPDRLSSITALRNAAQTATAGVPASGSEDLALAIGPNPANGPVSVGFVPALGEPWRMEAYDVSGRRVALVGEGVGAGARETRTFDPTRGGRPTGPGIYWLRLASGSRLAVRRCVVLGR